MRSKVRSVAVWIWQRGSDVMVVALGEVVGKDVSEVISEEASGVLG